MAELKEIHVQPDAFRVAQESVLLVCELRSAMAVSVYDDTQAVGGLLHLRYVATSNDQPLDLTDNTLSSDLLLMDRFCKELRAAGARKHSWQVRIFGHLPETPGMEAPAATVTDLVKAYFADSRRAVESKEVRRPAGVTLRLHARDGHVWISNLQDAPATLGSLAPLEA